MFEGFKLRKSILNIVVAIVILSLIISTVDFPHFGLQESEHTSKNLVTAQYTARSEIRIQSNSDFDEQGFPGTGAEDDPYVISDYSIDSQSEAIFINETDAHFVIRNCNLTGSLGILIRQASNGTIENSTITADEQGISLVRTDSITIQDTEIRGSDDGIYAYQANQSSIDSCSIHHTDYGINIENGTFNDISNCDLFANEGAGIFLGYEAQNSSIFSNNIGWNGHREGSVLVTPHNAYDIGESNEWISNRWSDFEIQGESYIIDSDSQDFFGSSLTDFNLPNVEGSDDIRFDEGETGNSVHWNTTDQFMTYFEIWVDDGLDNLGNWYGGRLIYPVDDLTIGSHNVTAVFIDAAGNRVEDEIDVSVLLSVFSSDGTIYIFYGSLLSVFLVIMVLIVMKKMR